MAGLFQLADGGQAVTGGALRGFKDTRVPMVIALAGYWIVGIGTAVLLAFPLGWGGVGVWSGLAPGLAVGWVGLMLGVRALTRGADPDRPGRRGPHIGGAVGGEGVVRHGVVSGRGQPCKKKK